MTVGASVSVSYLQGNKVHVTVGCAVLGKLAGATLL